MELMFCLFIFMMFGFAGVFILSQQDFDEFEEKIGKRKKQNQLEGAWNLWI